MIEVNDNIYTSEESQLAEYKSGEIVLRNLQLEGEKY